MTRTKDQELAALLVQALRTALALIDEAPAAVTKARVKAPGCKVVPGRQSKRDLPTGVYKGKGAYNPYRAYAWNGGAQVYLGQFSSVAAAKRARREYLAGKQVTGGTCVTYGRPPLQLVKSA